MLFTNKQLVGLGIAYVVGTVVRVSAAIFMAFVLIALVRHPEIITSIADSAMSSISWAIPSAKVTK
jgi:hypothetical protein